MGSKPPVARWFGWKAWGRWATFPNVKVRRGGLFFAILTLVLVVIATAGFIWFRKDVTIEVDGTAIERTTIGATVGDVLKEARVSLSPGDEVSPSQDQRLKDGMKIVIERAVPVILTVGGAKRDLRTTAKTVRAVLSKEGISLGPMDQISPALDSVVAPGMKIDITRVSQKVVTRRVVVPFRTEKRPDSHLDKGRTRVLSKGVDGLREESVKVTYENGKKIKEEIVSAKVIVPPVHEVIAYGTRNPLRTLVTSRGTYRYRDSYYMIATAFEPGPRSCGKYADGYTAIGVKAQRGVVAVDPDIIPLKTRLYVEGYGPALAADVGAAIKGYKIDLFFPTVEECLRFGRRRVKVYVLEPD
ncbi:MAG: DUF348 domain-containing protein [Firmicutes bacterium]|nr:DUF348 domain-containing protein [Bacillota bacterium]